MKAFIVEEVWNLITKNNYSLLLTVSVEDDGRAWNSWKLINLGKYILLLHLFQVVVAFCGKVESIGE